MEEKLEEGMEDKTRRDERGNKGKKKSISWRENGREEGQGMEGWMEKETEGRGGKSPKERMEEKEEQSEEDNISRM